MLPLVPRRIRALLVSRQLQTFFQNDVLSVFICCHACKACPQGGGGENAPVGNLALCLAGNRRRKQTEDRGGFTASWSISVVGQSHLLGMAQAGPGGAQRGAKQQALANPNPDPNPSILRITSQIRK